MALDTTVNGGLQWVYDNGLARDSTINDDGIQIVGGHTPQPGIRPAKAENTTVNGGTQFVFADGQTSNTLVQNGGNVVSIGLDKNTTVNTGGQYSLGLSLDGDRAIYSSSARSENLNITNGSAQVYAGTVNGAIISGENGSLGLRSPQNTDYPVTLLGSVSVADRARLIAQNGVNLQAVNLTLSNGGRLLLNESSECVTAKPCEWKIDSLNMNDGSVVFHGTEEGQTSSAYHTLITKTLSGNGSFYLHTQMANGMADQLKVTGEASGSHKVYISDSGQQLTEDANLTLVSTGGGNANFSLGNEGGVVDFGTWEYTLMPSGENNWNLTKNGRITPSAAGVLNMAAVVPLVFDAELESVRGHLDELKGKNEENSAWSAVYSKRNDVSTNAGAAFEQTLTGLTVGTDARNERENGVTTHGVFFSYSHSDIGFNRGGKGNVDSYSAGAYVGWEHENGTYVDGVAKFNRFAQIIHGKTRSGGVADGNYYHTGVGGHIEGGMHLREGEWGVTPYAAFTGFTTDRFMSYQTGCVRKWIICACCAPKPALR
ncbi:autotransporter outer membrane beta-barrel domain-containing protein [Escherichia coli]|nr:autotransporter outer membrane beta-barrel domain-containing protein [Escherichia coli]EKY5128181.1 autotransporter outer membrane beta-barrel domain-containing protein [Escherichia coli]MXF12927.1 autotransporter outer membrane beta-barrel domain-containing protein [Escherichia coli]